MKNINLSGVVGIIPCLLLLAGFLLVADSCRQAIQTPVCEPGAVAGPGERVPEGFVPLFNGINLDGWKVRQSENRDWQVVEGVIDCDPHEGRGDRNLWTNRSCGDFELLVDWRPGSGTNCVAASRCSEGRRMGSVLPPVPPHFHQGVESAAQSVKLS